MKLQGKQKAAGKKTVKHTVAGRRCGSGLAGGHVHFKLHSSQFLSKFQTVWSGDSPDAYAVANFFVWP